MSGTNKQNRGGRPKKETIIVQISLSLHPGEDHDLIDFFASLPIRGRAKAVVAALRTGNIQQVLVDEGVDDDQMAEDMLESFLR